MMFLHVLCRNSDSACTDSGIHSMDPIPRPFLDSLQTFLSYGSVFLRLWDRNSPTTCPYLSTLTFKALWAVLANSSGRAGRQLTPFHLLTTLACSVGGAVTDEVIPHGVTYSRVETGVDLRERNKPKIKDNPINMTALLYECLISYSQHRHCHCCSLLQRWWVSPGCKIPLKLLWDKTAVVCC